MYQSYVDNIGKISAYLQVINEFKSDIREVHIYNEIKEHFGKLYCRVHVEINLNKNSDKEIDLHFALHNEFRYFESRYFPFHLGSRYKPTTDDDFESMRNKPEEVHFNYIWHLIELNLKEKVPIRVSNFISENTIRFQEEEYRRERQKEQEEVEEVVKNLQPLQGQLIATKDYNGLLKIWYVNKVTVPNRRQEFSMQMIETLKSLSLGKKERNFYSKTDIYAIIDPIELHKGCSAPELIKLIELGESFSALIWRRPQSFWR